MLKLEKGRRGRLDEKYLFTLGKAEMREKVRALTGFEKERNEIKMLANIIFSNGMKNTEKYMKFLNLNGNVLLFGKPGTGKTSICYDCMLDNVSASCYQLNMSALISEKLGKTAQKVDEIFQEILNETKKYPVYLLIEEIEAFLPNRRESKDLEDMKRALTIFMHYLDKTNPNLVIICTTNYVENLDPAIIRRFSYKVEINNCSTEDIEKFLSNEENPFHVFFKDKLMNKRIAEEAFKRKMTFSDLKNMMKIIFLEGGKKGINNVNGNNLYKIIVEER